METATATRITAGYPGIAEKTGTLPGANEYARSMAMGMGMAEKYLEGSFLPDRDTLVSFLVNALYLFGDQGIAAYGGLPEGVEAELSRLGHKVAHGRYLRGGRKGWDGREAREARESPARRSDGTLPQPQREGGRDRALFLAQAFGRGGDEGIMETLRAMRKTVRPGGLVCFHVFDRDRAWSLVGERTLKDGEGPAKVRLGFQPETGRITVRVAKDKDRAAEPVQGAEGEKGAMGTGMGTMGANPGVPGAGGQASVKAWNLGEIRSLLRSAGLQLERAYGDWDGGSPEAAGAATGRLIIVAARPRMARNRTARIRVASGDGR